MSKFRKKLSLPRLRWGMSDLAPVHIFIERAIMAKNEGSRFERHRQPWTSDEIQKLHTLAKKDMPLKQIAKALTRSEESVKDRAKIDGLKISKLR